MERWAGKAPYILNICFVRGKGAGRKGSALAHYIATREGVSLVEREQAPDPQIHARYLSERPGSTGLFGADPTDPPRLETVQDEVGAVKWHWQIVLSMREPDAMRCGLTTPADWRDVARRVMPQFATETGLGDNLRWVAAMHQKVGKEGVGQPHIHVIAWVRPGARGRRPDLSKHELRNVRRAVAREVFGPLRAQLAAERTAARDTLVAAGKHNLAQMRRLTLQAEAADPQPDKLPPPFPRTDLQALAEKIEALAPSMPGKGQVALAYMPEPVKQEARAIADWVLERPALAEALSGLERATRDLTALYSGQQQAGDAAWQRARGDVRDRVAQAVLRAASQHQRSEVRAKRERVREVRQSAGQVLRAAHNALERERRRSEAKAELGRMSAAEAAEEKGRRERSRQMGLER